MYGLESGQKPDHEDLCIPSHRVGNYLLQGERTLIDLNGGSRKSNWMALWFRTITQASMLQIAAGRAFRKHGWWFRNERCWGSEPGQRLWQWRGGVACKRYLGEDSTEFGNGLGVGCERERLDSRVTAKFLAWSGKWIIKFPGFMSFIPGHLLTT